MEGHIRVTAAANNRIQTRSELAALLQTNVEFVADVTANPSSYYAEFLIPKPSGEMRPIRPPRRALRSLQRDFLREILSRVQLRSCLHGGIRSRSIVTHARAHVGQDMVATLDIRKFFPSTTKIHLIPILTALGFLGEAATDLLLLVTFKNELPQGAPTSSILANLAFAQGDSRFIQICRKRKLRYSRYVDDIAISGQCDFSDLRGPFIDAIQASDYGVANEKIHFMRRCKRQIVTGLVVNEKLRPTREFIQEIKEELRCCLEFGAALRALESGLSVRQLKSRLTGRVAHVAHVDPLLGKELRRLLFGVDWRSSVRKATTPIVGSEV